MMASLDLNAPQQATRKFKPSLVDITTKVEGKTFQSSSKSANWSLLDVNESEFYGEAFFIYHLFLYVYVGFKSGPQSYMLIACC